jgi:hypothetical protein
MVRCLFFHIFLLVAFFSKGYTGIGKNDLQTFGSNKYYGLYKTFQYDDLKQLTGFYINSSKYTVGLSSKLATKSPLQTFKKAKIFQYDILKNIDPIQHGTNWYSYVGGDPVNKTDPSGYQEFHDIGMTYNMARKMVGNAPRPKDHAFIGKVNNPVEYLGFGYAAYNLVTNSEQVYEAYNNKCKSDDAKSFKNIFMAAGGIVTSAAAIKNAYKSGVKYKANKAGVGRYGDVGGHHVHAKAAFKDNVKYSSADGFAISQSFMREHGLDHQAMTNYQRKAFKELALSGRPNI